MAGKVIPVLVVENDDAFGQAVTTLLMSQGYTASTVMSPEEAFEILEATRDPQIILMDAGQVGPEPFAKIRKNSIRSDKLPHQPNRADRPVLGAGV